LLKGSGACPECNVPLRKQNFRIQLFEDSAVDKEVDIRRKILKEYNKRQEDFATLKDYNDYLVLVYNLFLKYSFLIHTFLSLFRKRLRPSSST